MRGVRFSGLLIREGDFLKKRLPIWDPDDRARSRDKAPDAQNHACAFLRETSFPKTEQRTPNTGCSFRVPSPTTRAGGIAREVIDE